MAADDTFTSVLVPVLTPFGDDLAPDPKRFVDQCQRLLAEGAAGLAVFGTTSEANSMAADERMRLLDALLDAGVAPDRLMPGTGACSITEAIRVNRHAVERGCRGVLMLPPFYYKGMSEDGLFAFFARVIEGVGSDRFRVYLYHIPPVAQVAFSLSLIGRLIEAFPNTVVGLKDSSGQWESTLAILTEFPDFAVFPGAETFLLKAMQHGAAGCISATANVNLPAIKRIYDGWREPGAEELQAKATEYRAVVQGFPVVPALKAIVAHRLGDPAWAQVRPPMADLPAAQARKLIDLLAEKGFESARRATAAAE